jgi:GNAT superfamily N-acetyltransferase
MGKDGSGKKAKGGTQEQKDVVGIQKHMHMSDHQSAMITIRAALFDDRGKDKDMIKACKLEPMCKFNRNDLIADIKFHAGKDMTSELTEYAFDLTKINMEEVYDASGYGWADFDKQEELCDQAARFLIATNAEGEPIAFVHFRISLQGDLREELEGDAALIVYDIQVEAEHQRKGLGKHMMMLCELIARKSGLAHILAPVVHGNESGEKFIKNLRPVGSFVRDTGVDGLDDCRVILSKCLDKTLKEKAARQAKANADVQALAKQLMQLKAPAEAAPAPQTTPKKAKQVEETMASPASVSAFQFTPTDEAKKAEAPKSDELELQQQVQ